MVGGTGVKSNYKPLFCNCMKCISLHYIVQEEFSPTFISPAFGADVCIHVWLVVVKMAEQLDEEEAQLIDLAIQRSLQDSTLPFYTKWRCVK